MVKYLSILICLIIIQFQTNAQERENVVALKTMKVLENNSIQEIPVDQEKIFRDLKNKSGKITLPYLNSEHAFSVKEFSIHDGGGNPFPEIRTYKIYSLTDKTLSGRLTTGPGGLNISYLKRGHLIRVYPEDYSQKSNKKYTLEIGVNNRSEEKAFCSLNEHEAITDHGITHDMKVDYSALKRNGSVKRIYRVALVCTGEYGELNGSGSRQLLISNLSDISAIFEREMSFELVLSAGSPLVNNDRTTDPFDPNNGSRPAQAQNAISSLFPTSVYDIGHVFHRSSQGDGWEGGGVAGLGVVCQSSKASGWSSTGNNMSNAFISLAAHEFGHQFNCPHTWNGDGGGGCTEGNHPMATAYEIGSGTTIMSYNGLCEQSDNIPSSGTADDYFHANSLERMTVYAENRGICNESEWISDNNTPPVANANPCDAVYMLPVRTPFILRGEGSDADGDVLTYVWEQYDEDGATSTATYGEIGSEASLNNVGPLFRSFPPSSSPERTIPNLNDLRNNTNSPFEALPQIARNINFRLVVRDNNPNGGAVDWDQITMRVQAGKGPLFITSQMDEVTVQAGSVLPVTWDTRGSEEFCAKADIKISLDGGLTFPFTLADDIDYSTGSFDVEIPAGFSNTEQARIMVQCDDYECYAFFDINNVDFIIESNCFASGSLLCDDLQEDFLFGSPDLDLDETVLRGTPSTSLLGPLDLSNGIGMDLAINNSTNTGCTEVSVDNPFQEFRFSVSSSGTYTFRLDQFPGSVTAYTIYDSSFDSTDPCESFIASNANFDGGFGFFEVFNVDLQSCTEYVMTANVTNNETEFLSLSSIEGPGTFVITPSNIEYEVTFFAFNAENDQIVAESRTADFSGLLPGDYYIKSAFFKASGNAPPNIVDPSTLVGRTESQIVRGINCIILGGNQKDITVIPSCFVMDITMGQQTTCDPVTNTYDQTISFFVDKGPGSGEVTINGQTFPMTSNDVTVTLTGLISDGLPVDLDFTFSDDISCDRLFEEVFTAPANCCPFDINLGSDLEICEGDMIELDAGEDGETYVWFRDGEEIQNTDSKITVTESGEYSVEVSNNTGCKVLEKIDVTFAPNPTLSLNRSGIEVCDGRIVPMIVTTDATDIVWFKDGVEIANGTDEISVTSDGDFEVVVTSNIGCVTTREFNAVFLETPEPFLGDDQLTCNGSVITLDAGVDDVDYEWKRNNFTIDDETTRTLEATLDGTYVIAATNDFGCTGRDTVWLVFEPLEEIDIARDDVTRCEGESFTVQIEEDDFPIVWTYNGQVIPDFNGMDLEIFEPGIYTATINQNEQCNTSDSIELIVLDAPDLGFPEVISSCPGEDVVLTIDDPSASNIKWTFESTGIETEDETSITVSSNEVIYIETQSNTTFCFARDTITVNFANVPILDLGPDINACDGEPVELFSDTGGFQVEWLLNGEIIEDETGPSLIATEAGQYTIKIDAGSNCNTESNVMLSYSPSPLIDLGDDRSSCPDEPVLLTAGLSNETHEWSSEEDGILSETSNILSVTKTGTYFVAVTNAGDCTTRDTVTITFTDLPILDLGDDISNCEDDIFTINANANGFPLEWFRDGNLLPETSSALTADMSGMYIARVSSGANCSLSDTINITYKPNPVIDLGSDISECPGTPVILEVNNDNYSFQWTSSLSGDLNNDTNTLEVNTSATYSVLAMTDEGCTASDDVIVDFVELPILDLGADINICEGTEVTLSNDSNGFDIEWLKDGEVLMGEIDESISITEGGTYVMRVASSVDCTTSDTVEVVFFQIPEVDLGLDRSACPDEPVELIGGDSNDTYEWSSETQGILAETSNMLSVITSDTYYVSVINEGGCEKRDTVEITFTPLPILDLGEDISGVCEGSNLTIIANSNGFETSWLLNDEILIDETDESLSIQSSGTYIAIAAASDDCAVSDTIEVQLTPAPEITSLADQVACEGEMITLTAGTDAIYNYEWSNESGVITSGESGTITVDQNGIYNVVATDSDMCTSSTSAEVTFIAQPLVELDESIDFCQGSVSTIVASSNVNVIEWYFDGAIVNDENEVELLIESPGEYVAVVGSGSACEDRDTIRVNEISAPEFSIDGLPQYCSSDIPATLSVNIESGENAQWFLDGEAIMNATNSDLEINVSGEYSIEVMNDTGCSTTEIISIDVVESAENDLLDIPDLCEGESFNMEATTNGNSFEWRLDGSTLAGEDNLNLMIEESGEYSFVSFNDAGCETITPFSINFNPVPIAELGDDIQSACIGFDITFEIPDENGNEYTWLLDGNTIANETSNTLTAIENGLYRVEVINSFGCSSFDETEVAFFEPPSLTVPEEESYCLGSSAAITVNTNASIIRWILNGNVVASDVTTFDVQTSGMYTIEVESDDGCVISDNIVVTEVENPDISIDDIELCPGESQMISIDNDFQSYTWTGVTATGPEAIVDFQEVMDITTEVASLTVVDENGCETTESFNVTYFPILNAQALSNRISICEGESIELLVSGGLMYNWSDPNSSLSALDIPNPIASPTETSTYTVEVSDICPMNLAEISIEVIVNGLPTANAGPDTCALSNVEFDLNASGGESYSWSNGELIEGSSNVQNPTILIEEPTTFIVTVTDINGCQNTDSVEVCILDDPLEILQAVTLISPNGDAKNDVLEFRGLEAFPINKLTVFNRWGNIIYKKTGYQNDEQRWDGTRNGEQLPADTYYYVLEFADFKLKQSITLIRD